MGAGDGLSAGGDLQFLQDGADMGFGGALGNDQLGGNLLIAGPFQQQAQHFDLTGGEGIARAGHNQRSNCLIFTTRNRFWRYNLSQFILPYFSTRDAVESMNLL